MNPRTETVKDWRRIT